jgi:hypothetical protein
LGAGKTWFYDELRKIAHIDLLGGFETFGLRNQLGLKKTSNKMSLLFSAHAVDSWVLANSVVGGHVKPDNISMVYLKPLKFYRRQLHFLNPIKGGIRIKQGGTMSMGLKRGSLVVHKKYKLCFVGGNSVINGKNHRISLRSVVTGKRVTQQAVLADIKFLAYNTFLTNF